MLVVVGRDCSVAIKLLFVGVLFDLRFADIVSRRSSHNYFQSHTVEWNMKVSSSFLSSIGTPRIAVRKRAGNDRCHSPSAVDTR